MDERNHVLIVEFFLSVAAAWFAYSYWYKRVRNDAFREKLFTIRDGLFDYMVENGLPFDMPAYGLLRSSLNGLIRTTDKGRYTLGVLAVFLRHVAQLPESERRSTTAAAIAEIHDPTHRAHFKKVADEVGRSGFMHVWLEGPISCVATPIVVMKLRQWDDREDEVVEVGVELSRRDDACVEMATA